MIRTLVFSTLLALLPLMTSAQPVTGTGPDKVTWMEAAWQAHQLTHYLRTAPLTTYSYSEVNRHLVNNPLLTEGIRAYLIGEIPVEWNPEQVMEPLLEELTVYLAYDPVRERREVQILELEVREATRLHVLDLMMMPF